MGEWEGRGNRGESLGGQEHKLARKGEGTASSSWQVTRARALGPGRRGDRGFYQGHMDQQLPGLQEGAEMSRTLALPEAIVWLENGAGLSP